MEVVYVTFARAEFPRGNFSECVFFQVSIHVCGDFSVRTLCVIDFLSEDIFCHHKSIALSPKPERDNYYRKRLLFTERLLL